MGKRIMNQKSVEKAGPQFYGIFGILFLIASIWISFIKRDWKYMGVGMMLSSILYFGSMSLSFLRRRGDVSDVVIGIFLGAFVVLGVASGLGMFLHHYGIDGIYHWFGHVARTIDKK